jgi:hypothetical protein
LWDLGWDAGRFVVLVVELEVAGTDEDTAAFVVDWVLLVFDPPPPQAATASEENAQSTRVPTRVRLIVAPAPNQPSPQS